MKYRQNILYALSVKHTMLDDGYNVDLCLNQVCLNYIHARANLGSCYAASVDKGMHRKINVLFIDHQKLRDLIGYADGSRTNRRLYCDSSLRDRHQRALKPVLEFIQSILHIQMSLARVLFRRKYLKIKEYTFSPKQPANS